MAEPTYHDIGDVPRLSAVFQVDGVDTDPTTVTLKIKKPGGSALGPYTFAAGQITRSAAGRYYKDITVDMAGAWYYSFEGTGMAAGYEESFFIVRNRNT